MVATTHAYIQLKQQMKLKQPDNFQNYACTDYFMGCDQNTKYKTYNKLQPSCILESFLFELIIHSMHAVHGVLAMHHYLQLR